MNKRLYDIFVLLLLLIFAHPTPVIAQQATSIRINSYQITEGDQAMGLSVYLTQFDDATGRAITSGSIQSAEISILDMDQKYPATVRQADTPFYIALLLDASGSMTPAAKALREAAKQAVTNPPKGAKFAVFQFDEELRLIHDFTENKDVVADAIDKVQPRYGKGTCLYDAAYDTIDALSKTPKGRRALILFTDGKDEKSTGGICSRHGYDQLVAFANSPASPTPINTIGMAGNEKAINATELQNMAATTGGFAAIGSQGALGDLFKQIIEALNSQWLVEAKIYPTLGKHNVVVLVNSENGTPLSATLNIESTKAYTVPPPPVSINLDGMEYNSNEANYKVHLSFVSPKLINELQISVWNADSGLKISENTFSELDKNREMVISSKGFETGIKYQLKIQPFDKDGKPITNEKGENLIVVHDFTYQPKTSTATLSIDSVSVETKTLVLSISAKGLDLAKEYDGWINNEETNTRVPNSEFRLPSQGPTLKIPVDKVPAGKYSIILRALDDKQQPLTTTEYKGLVYTPITPSIFSTLATGVVAAPFIIVGIVVILVVVMVWLMRGSKREKMKSGTPVLQGNLEVNLKPPTGELPISKTVILDRPKSNSQPAPPVDSSSSGNETFILDSAMLDRLKSKSEVAPAVPPPPAQPRAAISIRSSPMQTVIGKAFMVNQNPFSLGRGKDNHLVILDSKISRKHAQISYTPATHTYTIIDLASDNGTWLNGARLMPNSHAIIQNGSVIQLGTDTQLVFQVLS